MRKRVVALLLVMLSLVTLIACGSKVFTVTFDTDGGTKVDPIEVRSGKKVEEVPVTTKEKFTFQGWYVGDKEFKFEETPIKEDVTVKAKWDNNDKTPPAFIGAVLGELPALEHLKGHEIDLSQGVRVRDETTKEENVVVEIVDKGGYDKDLPGEYTIKFEAVDEAGNKSTATRKVTVHDTLVREYEAVIIGENDAEYQLNWDEALKFTSSGTQFRTYDIIQVMDKDFFITSYNEHKAEHTNNGLVPFFPNGVIVIVDNEMKVKHVRIAAGILVQINADGTLTEKEDIKWTNGVDATNGGGLFKGLIDEIDTIIPNGGKLMFVGNTAPEVSRKFLISSLFNTNYQGGAIALDDFNVDVTTLDIKLESVRNEIKLPDRLPTPIIKIENGFLTWEAIPNTKAYNIYIDGDLVSTTTSTSVSILDFELDLTGPDDDKYTFEVEAESSDIFKWTSSLKSDPVLFEQKDVLTSPEILVDEKTVTWNEVEDAVSYDIYLSYYGDQVLLENTEELEFNVKDVESKYVGDVDLYVVSVSEGRNFNSAPSNHVKMFFGEIETFKIGAVEVDILKTTAENYFRRRNDSGASGFPGKPYLFLITDINEVTKEGFAVNATEAYSTVVLLGKDGKPKAINTILAPSAWDQEKGWFENTEYPSNASQIESLKKYMTDGDMLLIGKNGNLLTVKEEGQEDVTGVNSRHFISHFYVKENANNEYNGEAWRHARDTFMDPKDVVFTITKK